VKIAFSHERFGIVSVADPVCFAVPLITLLAACVVALALGLSAFGLVQPAAGQQPRGCGPTEMPTFVFGFAALHDKLGAVMGHPTSCEYADPNGTGDTEQNTTTGLAFWRSSTNTPTFTDGVTHWALTPHGDVTWVGPEVDPPPDARVITIMWTPEPPTKSTGCVSTGGLPDPECTPGALNPDVRQDTVATTICVPGFSERVRPPTSVTRPLERRLLPAYGLIGASPADFELDHLISLELGGAPRDVANLWPEPLAGDLNARQKDRVENVLHAQVSSGARTLSEAQRLIATDWVSVFRQLT
jgi:hypothetical protein